ncbi:hypothetical protein KXS07_29895 [Inquilinus limosus]|uniref:hypothetical protein n=1 Tax=Inquilinus limosus TaxID=171674 RepID=UPI003F154CF9
MIYIGTYFTPELTEALLGRVLPKAGVAPLVADLPAGVEVSLRRAESRELLFVQEDTTAETAVLTSPRRGRIFSAAASKITSSGILSMAGIEQHRPRAGRPRPIPVGGRGEHIFQKKVGCGASSAPHLTRRIYEGAGRRFTDL